MSHPYTEHMGSDSQLWRIIHWLPPVGAAAASAASHPTACAPLPPRPSPPSRPRRGPWRWQSAELLRMALPAIVSDPASPALGFPALAALATTCGADAQAWQGDQVGVDLVRSQLELLLGLASNAEHEVRGVLVAALMWRIGVVGGLRPDEGTAAKEERVRVWATLCGWERETEMVLIVPHWSALRLPAAW